MGWDVSIISIVVEGNNYKRFTMHVTILVML